VVSGFNPLILTRLTLSCKCSLANYWLVIKLLAYYKEKGSGIKENRVMQPIDKPKHLK
jgi:hypothetical protein